MPFQSKLSLFTEGKTFLVFIKNCIEKLSAFVKSLLISFLVGYSDKNVKCVSVFFFFLSLRKPICNTIVDCEILSMLYARICRLIQPPQKNALCKEKKKH